MSFCIWGGQAFNNQANCYKTLKPSESLDKIRRGIKRRSSICWVATLGQTLHWAIYISSLFQPFLWGRWYLSYFITEDTEASFDYIICPSSHSWTWKGWDLNPGLSDPKDFDPKTYKDPKNLIPDSDLDDENKMN